MPDLLPLRPLNTAGLYPPLHAELIQLLRALERPDWDLPTVAGAWRVRDIAAHLLDGDLRKLAAQRDGHSLPVDRPLSSYDEVLHLIQKENARGVSWGARLSVQLLTDLLEVTGGWMSDLVASLDPDAPAIHAVAWAGETLSDNRFDTAREYTERWHHQMQIRVAVGERGRSEVLLAPQYLQALLETSVRVLPYAYRSTPAPVGTTVVLRVLGEAPASWTLLQDGEAWRLYGGEPSRPDVRITARPELLWRLFFNALTAEEAAASFEVEGAENLAKPLLRARSVMV